MSITQASGKGDYLCYAVNALNSDNFGYFGTGIKHNTLAYTKPLDINPCTSGLSCESVSI